MKQKLLQRAKATSDIKKGMQKQLTQLLKDDVHVKDVTANVLDEVKKNEIPPHEAVVMVSSMQIFLGSKVEPFTVNWKGDVLVWTNLKRVSRITFHNLNKGQNVWKSMI